jgi:sensor histidine kinase regulating citrate/malate metabolism
MFYRGSVLSSGNGLGLYLVKCALKKVNGSIDLETKEGSHSSFMITLPNEPGKKQ